MNGKLKLFQLSFGRYFLRKKVSIIPLFYSVLHSDFSSWWDVESIWSFHLRYSLCLCEIWINLIFIFIWKLFPGIPDSWNAFLFQQIEIKWNYYVSIHMCKTIIKNYVPCKRLWPTLWLSDVIIFHFHLVLFWSGPHFFSCLQLSNLKSKVIFVMLFFLK